MKKFNSLFAIKFQRSFRVNFLSVLAQLRIVRSLQFYKYYFEILRQIHLKLAFITPASAFHYFQLRVYQFSLVNSSVVCFFRAVYGDNLPYLLQIAQYNFVYLEGFRAHWNVWFGVFALISAYFYELAFFQNNGLTSKWIKAVLLDGQPMGFIWPVVNCRLPFLGKYLNRDMLTVSEYFQVIALTLLNGFRVGFIANGLYYLQSQIKVYQQFKSTNLFLDLFGLLAYLFFQGMALVTVVTFHIGIRPLTIVAHFGVIIMLMGALRLRQVSRFINSLTPSNLKYRLNLPSFLKINDFTVRLAPDINRIYGKAIFAFLLVGLPTNSILMMMLANRHLSLSVQLIFLVVVFFEIFFLFIIHLSSALIVLKLHQPVKRLMSISLGYRGLSLSWKLKLTRYFEQFHSTNQFTVNYGNAGKITIHSFSKHLMYYLKMLIFAWKIIHNLGNE